MFYSNKVFRGNEQIAKAKLNTSSTTFPQSLRLKTANSFSAVFKQATKLQFREFSVYFKANRLNYPRLGLAISKKNAKKAVTRNLIKRIIRENFRNHQDKLVGWDIIIVSKYAASQCSKEQLHASIQTVWQRLEK